MSINLLLPGEEEPVIWRGPVIAGTVKQFWTDVIWGDLDYLFVDMPPGTGDVPLTVFQSLPVDGVVIVSSPQDLVRMIVMKAYKMAQMMKVPVLGIVENYSYLVCPDCGKRAPFSARATSTRSQQRTVPVLGKMPIDVELCNQGRRRSFQQDPTMSISLMHQTSCRRLRKRSSHSVRNAIIKIVVSVLSEDFFYYMEVNISIKRSAA